MYTIALSVEHSASFTGGVSVVEAGAALCCFSSDTPVSRRPAKRPRSHISTFFHQFAFLGLSAAIPFLSGLIFTVEDTYQNDDTFGHENNSPWN